MESDQRVSVHINVGAQPESQMLGDIEKVSENCMEWGTPLLIMAYPRGPSISDSFDPKTVAHAARVATELGADVVKCSFTGDFDSFSRVIEGALAPVLIQADQRWIPIWRSLRWLKPP